MYNHKDFLVFYPKTVNFKKLVNLNPEKYKKLNLDIPKCFLYEILSITAYKIEKEKRKNKEWNYRKLDAKYFKVGIYSGKLKELFSNNYKISKDLLIPKVLFKDNYSIKDKETYKYYFNDVHKAKPLIIDSLDTKKKTTKNLIVKYKNDGSRFKKDNSNLQKKFRFLLKFFNPEKLNIDVIEAKKQIENDLILPDNYSRYIIDLNKIIALHNGIYRFAFNPNTDSRFHNNFNQLNKSLRKYVNYDGKKLVEIDLSNSVPFFLSSILSDSILFDFQSILSPSLNHLSYMFHKSSKTLTGKDIELFYNNCINGSIYLSLKDEYINEFKYEIIDEYGNNNYDVDEIIIDINDEQIRKRIKKDLLMMFFSKNSQMKRMQRVFGKSYPTVLEFIVNSKKRYYKRFSHILYQIEANVMLEFVARGFNQKHNGKIPLFTIHDCIVTTVGNEQKLNDYMLEVFTNMFKNPPQMKIKYW